MQYPKVILSAAAAAAMSLLLWHGQAQSDAIDAYQPQVLKRAGRALELGRPELALSRLEGETENLRPGPLRAAGFGLACRAWFELEDFASAQQACDAAVREGGGASAWSHLNNRGVMRLMLGEVEAALADFNAAAELNPVAGPVRRNLALAREARDSGAKSAGVSIAGF